MEVNRSSTLFLEREMIFPKLEFDSRTEVLQYMAHQFTKLDLAKESYAAALIEREAHFPTVFLHVPLISQFHTVQARM